MIRPNIYLGGPIEGRTIEEAHQWREVAQKLLEPRLCAVSPLRAETKIGYGGRYGSQVRYDQKFGSASAIRHKNMLDVFRCDGMLAYLPSAWLPAYGTLLEIGWAQTKIGYPIVVVTDDMRISNHPVFCDGVGWILPNLEAAAEVFHGLFDVYSEETHQHGLFLQRNPGYTPITDTTVPRATSLYRAAAPQIERVTMDGYREDIDDAAGSSNVELYAGSGWRTAAVHDTYDGPAVPGGAPDANV